MFSPSKPKVYGSDSWVEDKIGVSPKSGDKKELLLGNRVQNTGEEEFVGSNKSLCVSLCVLAFSIPALIGA